MSPIRAADPFDGTQVVSGRCGVLPSTTLRAQGAAGTLWIDPATNRAGYHDYTGTQLLWSQDRVRAPQPMNSLVTVATTRIGYLSVASGQSGNLVHAIHYTDRQGRHSYQPPH